MEEDPSLVPPSFEELLGLTPPDMIEDVVANDIAPLSPPSPKRQDVSFWSSFLSTSTSRQNGKQDGEVTVTVEEYPVQDVIMGDTSLGFPMDDALLLADADYFDRQTLPEVNTISPMVLSFPPPFQLAPPSKRASTDGQPLSPSPLRIAKNSSTSTLNSLAQTDIQCGLGISMSEDEPQKMSK